MRVLIIGGSGFIGSNLVNFLSQKNWQINLLLKRKTKSYPKNVRIFPGDITNLDSLKQASRNCRIIFNLAAILPHYRGSSSDFYRVNVDGVKNLVEIVKGRHIKLIHLSTVGVYKVSKKVINEQSKISVTDLYSKTKVEGDDIIKQSIVKDSIKAVIIRPTIAYGPFDKRPVFLKLFKFIKMRTYIQIGNGQNLLHTIFVGNLVEGIFLAATNPKADGQDFIIGDKRVPTFGEIVESIAKIEKVRLYPVQIPISLALLVGKIFDLCSVFGFNTPLDSQAVRFMTENRIYSIAKAQRILGYKPRINLNEGLDITYRWYRKNDLV